MALVPAFTEKPQQQVVKQGILRAFMFLRLGTNHIPLCQNQLNEVAAVIAVLSGCCQNINQPLLLLSEPANQRTGLARDSQ